MLVLVHVYAYLPDLEHDPFIIQSLYHINCPHEGFQEPLTQTIKMSSIASDDKGEHVSSCMIMQFVFLAVQLDLCILVVWIVCLYWAHFLKEDTLLPPPTVDLFLTLSLIYYGNLWLFTDQRTDPKCSVYTALTSN